jgi:hypothetical protein
LQQCFLRKGRYKVPNLRVNPLEELAGVTNRGYSRRCQKFMTDFGIEESFQQAANRMEEHHGVKVNVSAVRNITLKHANRAAELLKMEPAQQQKSKQMISE